MKAIVVGLFVAFAAAGSCVAERRGSGSSAARGRRQSGGYSYGAPQTGSALQPQAGYGAPSAAGSQGGFGGNGGGSQGGYRGNGGGSQGGFGGNGGGNQGGYGGNAGGNGGGFGGNGGGFGGSGGGQSSGAGEHSLKDTIPGGGEPGVDYPILAAVPETSFSCDDYQTGGYYADINDPALCQVFHICYDNRMDSFLCPNGTLFNQQYFVCDWWYNVDCAASESFFQLNEEIGKTDAAAGSGSGNTGNGNTGNGGGNGGYGSSNGGNRGGSFGNGGNGFGNGGASYNNGGSASTGYGAPISNGNGGNSFGNNLSSSGRQRGFSQGSSQGFNQVSSFAGGNTGVTSAQSSSFGGSGGSFQQTATQPSGLYGTPSF